MSTDTSIEWATHSFSPWHGCAKVSAGCKNCYAEVSTPVRVKRARGLELWGPAKMTRRMRTAESTWKLVRAWNRRAAVERELAENAEHVREHAKAPWDRPRVFPSLCDVFEDHPDAAAIRPDFWALIEETPELDWLLLTKRPENVPGMVPWQWMQGPAHEIPFGGWPANVWIGTSVEDQATADQRIPHLLVRFLSLEPLLGPVDLSRWLVKAFPSDYRKLDWLIIGGESGPDARPCDVAWIRDLVRQGREAGVPVFVKQLGGRVIWRGISGPGQHWPGGTLYSPRSDGADGFDVRLAHPKGGDPAEWPEDLRVREMPARRA